MDETPVTWGKLSVFTDWQTYVFGEKIWSKYNNLRESKAGSDHSSFSRHFYMTPLPSRHGVGHLSSECPKQMKKGEVHRGIF